MPNKNLASLIGGLTGALALLAMIRLVGGLFAGGMSTFAWVMILLAMGPWVLYVAHRARHGQLDLRASVAVLALDVSGFVSVWLSTLGPVVALAFSLVAFGVVWVRDWPERRPRSEEGFVRIEDLQTEELDESLS